MSLNWQWADKCGEVTLVQKHPEEEDREFTITLYDGNCYLIMLHEYEEKGENMYSLFGFFADKEHMKNCLGLNKKQGYTENIHNKPWDRFVKFRLNKNKCRYINDIVPALVKAFDNIEIEIYTD